MKKNQIIAFNGKMGVGKSTAIEFLNKGTAKAVRNIKFAQPLYDMQKLIYETIDMPVPEPKDRKLLQWLGTDWGRSIDENLWVNIFRDKVKALFKDSNSIVTCDDVRFDNEAKTIKLLGGVIVKIVSTKTSGRIDTKAGIPSHASEVGIDSKYVDYTIENNGSLEDFKNSLIKLYKELGVGLSAY